MAELKEFAGELKVRRPLTSCLLSVHCPHCNGTLDTDRSSSTVVNKHKQIQLRPV